MDLLDAVCYQNVEAVRELAANGADIHGKDTHGRTPLMRAAEWNGPESISVLIGLGARVNDRNDRGETALHIAAASGHREAARELLDRGADLAIRDQHRSIALTTALAAPMGFTERSLAVAKLIAARMDVEALRPALQQWLTDEQLLLDGDRAATNRNANGVAQRFKELGAVGFSEDERDRLRKFAETALKVDEQASALTESSREIAKRLIDAPRDAIEDLFNFGQRRRDYCISSGFLRGDSVFAIQRDR